MTRGINPWVSSLPDPTLVPQYRGVWVAAPYQIADIVKYNNALYIAHEEIPAGEIPAQSTKWVEVLGGDEFNDLLSNATTVYNQALNLNATVDAKVNTLTASVNNTVTTTASTLANVNNRIEAAITEIQDQSDGVLTAAATGVKNVVNSRSALPTNATVGDKYYILDSHEYATALTVNSYSFVTADTMKGVAITATTFGNHNNSLNGLPIANWHKELGYGTIRFWDTQTNWRQLEPTKGQFNWTNLDAMVNEAIASNIDMLMCLGQAPDWATGGSSSSQFGGSYNSKNPANIQDWRDFITAIGTRYKGKIRNWEIWNEPNLVGFWSGTVSQLVTLTQEAKTILKAIDPANMIVSPSPTGDGGGNGPSYMDSLFAAGIGSHLDVVGLHLYNMPLQPEQQLVTMRSYRDVLEKYNYAHLPIWNTEITYSSYTQLETGASIMSGTPTLPMSDAQAISYMLRTHLTNLIAGVDRIYWYGSLGQWASIRLINPDDKTQLTPTGFAYQELVNNLVGSHLVSYSITDGLYVAVFEKQRRRFAYTWTGDNVTLNILNSSDIQIHRQKLPNTPSTPILYGTTFSVSHTPIRLLQDNPKGLPLPATKIKPVANGSNLLYNSYFLLRNGGSEVLPGWDKTLTITPYADIDAAPHSRPITLTATSQYQALRQSVTQRIVPGQKYVMEVRYKGPNLGVNEWYFSLEGGAGTTPFTGVSGYLTPSATFTTKRIEFTWPLTEAGASPDLRINLVNASATNQQPVTVEFIRLLTVTNMEEVSDPRRRVFLGSYPTLGSFAVDDRVVFRTPAAITTHGPEIVCSIEGTFGTVDNFTVTTTTASSLFTVNDSSLVRIGDVFTYVGSNLRYTVTDILNATQIRTNKNADVVVSSAVAQYTAPTFISVLAPALVTTPIDIPTSTQKPGFNVSTTSNTAPKRYFLTGSNKIRNPNGDIGGEGWTVVSGTFATATTGVSAGAPGRMFDLTSLFEIYQDCQVLRQAQPVYFTLETATINGTFEYQIQEYAADGVNLIATPVDWTTVTTLQSIAIPATTTNAGTTGIIRVRLRSTAVGQKQFRGIGLWVGLPGVVTSQFSETFRWFYDNKVSTTQAATTGVLGLVRQAAASANTAVVAAGTAPTKAEFDALLAELRDLKTKLNAAGIIG